MGRDLRGIVGPALAVAVQKQNERETAARLIESHGLEKPIRDAVRALGIGRRGTAGKWIARAGKKRQHQQRRQDPAANLSEEHEPEIKARWTLRRPGRCGLGGGHQSALQVDVALRLVNWVSSMAAGPSSASRTQRGYRDPEIGSARNRPVVPDDCRRRFQESAWPTQESGAPPKKSQTRNGSAMT